MKYSNNYRYYKSKVATSLLVVCVIFYFWWTHQVNVVEIPGFENLKLADYPPLGVSEAEELPTEGESRIPKIIHQTWITTDLPHKYVDWVKSWVDNHPDWTYMFWTDTSARQLIVDTHPELLPAYDGYLENIRRADAMRYVILYEFGGVYLDLDMESLRPLDPLLRKYSCFLPQEPYEHPIVDGNFEHLAINALMACKPKHPLMKKYLDNLPNFAHMWKVLDSTGPHYITLHYRQYLKDTNHTPTDDDGVYLAPAEYFFPTMDSEKFSDMKKMCKKFATIPPIQKRACISLKLYGMERKPYRFSFAYHHWDHTYFQSSSSLARRPVSVFKIAPKTQLYNPKVKKDTPIIKN